MTRPGRVAAALILVLLFLVGPSLLRFYTDWLWFGEVGYQQVFGTILRTQGTIFTATFVLAIGWFLLNLRTALSSIGDLRPVFTTREGLEVALPSGRQLRGLATSAAALLAVIVGLYASGRWETWLTWRYGVPFGIADPILHRDVGFYVYSLPFQQFLRGMGQAFVLLAALASGALYLVSGSLSSGFPGRMSMTPGARRHLSLLVAVFLLLMAWGAWLHRSEHLLETSGLIHGASYADVYGRMPVALLQVVAGIVGAALALMHAFGNRNWPIPAAIALYAVVAIGGEGYSSMLQRFSVTPNEQVRETPFIQHNIAATRRAFALDTVDERAVSGDARLTPADIERNAATLKNVRLWDHAPLLETFGQIQEIRTYYDFASVDNDRYHIDGALRQVMLSARELNSASLPARTWVNERLTFTHGYGLTLGPVNEVTSEGLPVLFVRNLPPETIPDLKIDEPSIYFGELTNEYVIVGTRTPEFHYPRGDENETTRYSGKGGVPLSSLWRKLLFALRFGSYQIILNDGITTDSRILFNRQIRERVERIAPFLSFDRDPYLVLGRGPLLLARRCLHDERSLPVLDAGGRINYIRNSVKFVVDAYDGTTTAYLADANDPLRGHLRTDLPQHVQAALGDAGVDSRARALSRRHLRDSGAGLRDVSHDPAGRVLQPRGSVGDPDSGRWQ
jgi:uncharacterized membrane protein (UPF0182 family)